MIASPPPPLQRGPRAPAPVSGKGSHPQPPAGPGGLRRLVAFDHCRVLLPQFTFLRHQDPLSRLHRLALSEPETAACARPLKVFFARVLFVFVALRQLPRFFLRYGAYVARHHGVARWRQLRDLWYCTWRHNQFSRHYYWRKLFLLPDRESWLEYLEHRQVNTLLDHLNRFLPITRATNKFLFYHHCLSHDLPTPEVLAAWTGLGRLITAVPVPLAQDLFVKPAADYGSVGIIIIPYDPVTRLHRFAQRHLTWLDLLAELARHARTTGKTLILQPRLRNAARSSLFGDTDICNLRIVTAHTPCGSPEPIGAFIRLPSSLTTTGHDRHVLIANVDLGNGNMGTGKFREIMKGEYQFHPDTGSPIAGHCVPEWSQMLALAVRAHRTFPWIPFVGWDIVDTDRGIMLLEANAYWGADALQLPGAVPLGRTRFPEIYLEWFDLFFGAGSNTGPGSSLVHA